MSLEGAIGEERELLAQLRGRQRQGADASTRSRSASGNPKGSGRSSRSVSAAPSVNEEQSYPESITFQDPSVRLSTKPVSADDINVSSEERLSDDDYELEFHDEGRVLPNYSSNAVSQGASGSNQTLDEGDELAILTERNMMKRAENAKIADSLLASERAISNATAIGRTVPNEVIQKLEKQAKAANTEIHVDPEEFYQEKSARKNKLEEYAVYKKKLISSGTTSNFEFVAPYTRDQEEKIDIELANVLNSKTKISEIDSDLTNQRAIRTITRGNFFENLISKNIKHPKSFMLCMDFSAESSYALEWCVGTVLVDSSVLYILNVIEDDEYSSMNLNGINPSSAGSNPTSNQHSSSSNCERTRANNVNEITKQVVDLLKRTKLQVHVVIESCHHPIPRHFIVGVIRHLSPTLVVVGSKGSSAIKGVLMGSLSNHLVRKSTVPVMVVRNRLKKVTRKTKFNNNLTSMRGLADARID
jgi:nucleotide-binding universal stress UspA family protein